MLGFFFHKKIQIQIKLLFLLLIKLPFFLMNNIISHLVWTLNNIIYFFGWRKNAQIILVFTVPQQQQWNTLIKN